MIKLVPLFEKALGKNKRPASKWRMGETCIKVKGQWTFLYRAVDNGAIRSADDMT